MVHGVLQVLSLHKVPLRSKFLSKTSFRLLAGITVDVLIIIVSVFPVLTIDDVCCTESIQFCRVSYIKATKTKSMLTR